MNRNRRPREKICYYCWHCREKRGQFGNIKYICLKRVLFRRIRNLDGTCDKYLSAAGVINRKNAAFWKKYKAAFRTKGGR